MTDKLVLSATVAYGDVDRQERMLLGRFFKVLQDAAILHANQFGAGTEVVSTRAESWVLNRIAAEIDRYPLAGETLRVETWSSGIKAFKGYRDFRVYDGANRAILRASSLWLYISLKSKSIVRVPRDLADAFLVGREPAWCPQLEKLPFASPAPSAGTVPLNLRYSDFDVNEHVNNAAYFELVQTALERAGEPAHPSRLQLKYAKEITTDVDAVEIRVEPTDTGARFSIESGDVVFAIGDVAR
jgi:acyl-ACP thioesterase